MEAAAVGYQGTLRLYENTDPALFLARTEKSQILDSPPIPDIVFFSVPFDPTPSLYPWDDVSDYVPMGSLAHSNPPSWGLPYLATCLEASGLEPAICWAHTTMVVGPDAKSYAMHPKIAAMIALRSGTRYVGISLASVESLDWSSKVITEMRHISDELHLLCPTIIVGGPQATLDSRRTAKELDIPLECVITGRGVGKLLKLLQVDCADEVGAEEELFRRPFDPRWLEISGYPRVRNGVGINVISVGGRSCHKLYACDFCGGKVLGEETPVPWETFKSQIDILAEQGFTRVLAVDDHIDLSNKTIRKEFLRRVKYAYSKSVPITFMYARPDQFDKASYKYLWLLNKYGIRTVFMGLESADRETLIAMRRLQTGQTPDSYLRSVKTACLKAARSGIATRLSGIIGYPWGNQDGVTADIATLTFVKNLEDEVRQIIPEWLWTSPASIIKSTVQIWDPYPGTPAYNRLVRLGLTPDQLLQYMLESKRHMAPFSPPDVVSLGDYIRRNPDAIKIVAQHCDARRKALQTLIAQVSEK